MLKKWIGSWLDDAPKNSTHERAQKLNLKKILVAHDELKDTLQYEIMGALDKPLNAQDIENTNTCDYGKWLHSVGKNQYSRTKEYINALEAHTLLCQVAADIVYTNQSGNSKKAKELLKTSFKEASNLNQIELVRLYNLTIN